jgi:hypothetical protein
MSKKQQSKPVHTTVFVGHLVEHDPANNHFELLDLTETTTLNDGKRTKSYSIYKSVKKTFNDALFGYGSGPSARHAVSVFMTLGTENIIDNPHPKIRFADFAVIAFCEVEMLEENSVKQNTDLEGNING